MAYGDKRDRPKIDLYSMPSGEYLGSTTWAKTLKEAKEQYAAKTEFAVGQLRAFFVLPRGRR